MTAFTNPDTATIDTYLRQAKTLGIVGLSSRVESAAYEVSQVMQEAGYQIIPINPKAAGSQILGQEVYGRLQDVPVHMDIVVVFRRSEFLPEVARDFLESDADVFWAQLGLESQEAADLLEAAGRAKIVMNRCIKIEYRRMMADQKD